MAFVLPAPVFLLRAARAGEALSVLEHKPFAPGGSATHTQWGISAAVRYLPRARTEEEERGVEIWALGGQVAILFEPSEWLRLSAGVAV